MSEARIVPPAEARATWRERWARHDAPAERRPSTWVMTTCARLPAGALVADLAGGDGRHAVPLARAGHRVVLLDFAERAVRLGVTAAEGLLGVVADTAAMPLRAGAFDAIVIVHFLERALFPHLPPLLRPGGRLIVETFTTAHLSLVAAGHASGPRNPAYMLAPGELPRLAAPLIVDEYAEVEAMDGPGPRAVARMVAVRA